MVKTRFLSRGLLSVMVGVYAFLYVPIFFVIVFSFNASDSLSNWSGFSMMWYKKLFMDTILWEAVTRSFQVAFFSATLSSFTGMLCALLFVGFKKMRLRSLLGGLSITPLVVPEVVIGLALLVFFVFTERVFGWPNGRGLGTITIAHTTISFPYATLILRSRLLDLDPALEEAALDLGAHPREVFFLVKLPLLMPALVSSWVLSFILSMDDLIVASFTSGPSSSTLPMVVFSQLKMGITPEMNALSALIVLFILAISPLTGFFVYVSLKNR